VRAGKSSTRGRGSRTGCLETGAIVVFALVLGAFAASTWMRHVGGRDASRGAPAATPADSLSRHSLERARIRVQVRNGSGIPGAAAQVTEYLREAGFDVVDFGNAEVSDEPRTVVIDRVGAREGALEVAAALRGVPIRSDVDTSLYLDVTVLVGRDAEAIMEGGPAGSRDTPGWRRWLRRLRALAP